MKHNIYWKIESQAASPNSPPFIKSNGSLPSPQKPAAILYLHPPVALRSTYMPTFHLHLCLPSRLLLCLPTKTLNVFFLSPTRVICLAHIVTPDRWHTQNKPLCSTTRHFLPPLINSPSLDPHIIPNTPFSDILKFILFADCLRSSLKPTQNNM